MGLAFLILLYDLAFPNTNKKILSYVAGILLALIGILIWQTSPTETEIFGRDIMVFDSFSRFFFVVFVSIGSITMIMSAKLLENREGGAEYLALILFSVVGAMGMAAAHELITAYISLELLTFTLYVLVGFSWKKKRSNEAALKYILMGAVASAFLLFGISYIYGITGSTHYNVISNVMSDGTTPIMLVGIALLTVGVGFKIAAVPFHMWTPDAYEGAPIPISGYLATGSKAAALALVIRLSSSVYSEIIDSWSVIFLTLAVASMVLGNLVAIRQSNMKRLMAYSSIGQVGFFILGIAAFSSTEPENIVAGLLIHSVSYAISTLAVFLVMTIIFVETGKEDIDDYSGLSQRNSLLAVVLTASLFSLAGFPFFIGFSSKFYLFTTIGMAGNHFIFFVGIAILASVISVFYYLKIIKKIYIDEPNIGNENIIKVNYASRVLLILLTIFLGVGGLYIAPLAELAEGAARNVFL